MGKTLYDLYGFQVTMLIGAQATRANILRNLSGYRRTLQDNDNLIIYYAGHGFLDKEEDRAYWLPVDADSPLSPNSLMADDLTANVRALHARHVLIISDSCYSGGLSRDADSIPTSLGQDAYINRMLGSRSRTLMASGGEEPVSDAGPDHHSVFAYALLQALKNSDQTMFTASDLFVIGVRRRVAGNSSQLPHYDIIRNSGHDDGDFVFVRTGARGANSPAKIVAANEVPPPVEGSRPPDLDAPRDTAPLARKDPPVEAVPPPAVDMDYAMSLYKALNYDAAFPLMKSACEEQIAHGCDLLGTMYEYGRVVASDPASAVALYRKACDGGDFDGCDHLAKMLGTGNGIARDYAESLALYRKTCDGGDTPGCLQGGLDAERTDGFEKAFNFYRNACDRGEFQGCTLLGNMYESGEGLDADKAEAATLYKKACDGGDPLACDSLKKKSLKGKAH